MKTISLRNIPPEVENAIRTRARQKRISVNKAVIELLEERVAILREGGATVYDDLGELAGAWSAWEAKAFQQVVEIARQKDLWR